MEDFPAHIKKDQAGENQIQSVMEHSRQTAKYAAEALNLPCLSLAGYFAGLCHDAGKCSVAFKNYIIAASNGEQVRRGSVNHSFGAVYLIFKRFYKPGSETFQNMVTEILAYGAGAHHGLFDCIDPRGNDGFEYRLSDVELPLLETETNFFAQCAGVEELDMLFTGASEEIKTVIEKCAGVAADQDEQLFYVSMLCRLLLSAVIDGDRRDTAEFMHSQYQPEYPADMRPIWRARLEGVENQLCALKHESDIDKARRKISMECGSFSAQDGGVYRLNVPTGSGKTLASLRLALSTALKHNKRRIIFVTPLLSVLEQNAKVIKDYLADGSLVLEHHSDVVNPQSNSEKLDDNELLLENWGAPVIITTLVQLLNTLFDGRTQCVRRMCALSGSAIVIDEIQSLPRNMLSQFNLAVNFLTRVCRVTVIMCSATQPCLESTRHKVEYSKPADVIEYNPSLWLPFRRTEILDRRIPGGYETEELADFAMDIFSGSDSVLIICNKKAQALTMYRLLQNRGAPVYHLSTAMCMADRQDTLKKITGALGKRPVICVATQLVEAGVDFSFGSVIRVSAGMENAVQAAGRCNRGGEFGKICPVYIVNWRNEDLSHLPEIKQAQTAAEELLYCFKNDSAAFDGALQSDKAIAYYYRCLYKNMPGGAQDYSLSELKTSMFEMLSSNGAFRVLGGSGKVVGQAFKTAGSLFRVFDDNTTDVIVPYRDGENIIAELSTARAERDFAYRKALLDEAKKYCVSMLGYQCSILAANNGVSHICQKAALAAQPGFYHDGLGICLEAE